MPRKKKEALVKKSNSLIRGIWNVDSIWEPRIVAILASKIHVNDTDFQTYKIPVFEILGLNYGGDNLAQLEKAVKNILKHPVTIQETPTRRAIYPIFDKCVIDSGTGFLELCFHPDLKPHFLKLQANFTSYSLAEYMSLSSVYSQKLYEILKSYAFQEYIEIPIADLYEALSFPVALRKNFNSFRVKVLEQAHKEIIKEGLSLQYEWVPVKSGRGGKVSAIRFVFKDVPKPKEDDEIIQAKLRNRAGACHYRLMKRGVTCTPRPSKSAKCAVCIKSQPGYQTQKHEHEKKPVQMNIFED